MRPRWARARWRSRGRSGLGRVAPWRSRRRLGLAQGGNRDVLLGGAGSLPLQQRLGALGLALRLDLGRLGAGEGGGLGIDLGPVDCGIDAEQDVTLPDQAAFLEGALADDAGDLRPHLGDPRRGKASRQVEGTRDPRRLDDDRREPSSAPRPLPARPYRRRPFASGQGEDDQAGYDGRRDGMRTTTPHAQGWWDRACHHGRITSTGHGLSRPTACRERRLACLRGDAAPARPRGRLVEGDARRAAGLPADPVGGQPAIQGRPVIPRSATGLREYEDRAEQGRSGHGLAERRDDLRPGAPERRQRTVVGAGLRHPRHHRSRRRRRRDGRLQPITAARIHIMIERALELENRISKSRWARAERRTPGSSGGRRRRRPRIFANSCRGAGWRTGSLSRPSRRGSRAARTGARTRA